MSPWVKLTFGAATQSLKNEPDHSSSKARHGNRRNRSLACATHWCVARKLTHFGRRNPSARISFCPAPQLRRVCDMRHLSSDAVF
jgi:hypothetical protein